MEEKYKEVFHQHLLDVLNLKKDVTNQIYWKITRENKKYLWGLIKFSVIKSVEIPWYRYATLTKSEYQEWESKCMGTLIDDDIPFTAALDIFRMFDEKYGPTKNFV